MKLAHLSDWHCDAEYAARISKQMKLYDEDVELVLITGDMLPNYFGSYRGPNPHIEKQKQRKEWLKLYPVLADNWPNAEFVAVPGNHDWCDYGIKSEVKSFDNPGPHFLKCRGLNITGFRGVPWFGGFWHGEYGDSYFDACYEGMDRQADIVLTHTPPWGILDQVGEQHTGAIRFDEWHWQNPPWRTRIHAFGHIHEFGGEKVQKNGVIFSNAAGTVNRIKL